MKKLDVITIHFGDKPLDDMRLACVANTHELAIKGGHNHHIVSDQSEVAGLQTTMTLSEVDRQIMENEHAKRIWLRAKNTKSTNYRGDDFSPIAMSDVARVWLCGQYDRAAYFDTDMMVSILDIPLPYGKPCFNQMKSVWVDIGIVYTNGCPEWFNQWAKFERHADAIDRGHGFIWPFLNSNQQLPGIAFPGMRSMISPDIGMIPHTYFTHKGDTWA
jgi:hypothetical protein